MERYENRRRRFGRSLKKRREREREREREGREKSGFWGWIPDNPRFLRAEREKEGRKEGRKNDDYVRRVSAFCTPVVEKVRSQVARREASGGARS